MLTDLATEMGGERNIRASAGRQSSDVLLRALAERDSDLGEHLDGVGDLACATAKRLGAHQADMEAAWQTGLLHDVGKVAIPDVILNKPGPLDEDEWAFMKRHTVIGERILKAAPALANVAGFVRSTHERYDGGGYPDGLAGDDIPLTARIVAVCDAYDAMVTKRAYRDACDVPAAIAELRRCSGTQFDPDVTEAFVSTLEAGDLQVEGDSHDALPLDRLNGEITAVHRASLADWAEFERRVKERDEAGDKRDLAADQRDEVGDQRDQAGQERDQAGDRRDQAADQRDQVADRRDQVGDQRDEAGEQREEAGNKRDQAGDQRDEAGEQRDEAADKRDAAGDQRDHAGDKRDHAGDQRDEAADQRDHAADRRDQAGEERDHAGDQRDEAGDQRDHAGDQRDEAAEERDHVAEESEALASAGITDAFSESSVARQEAASDRKRALQDRKTGASERTQAEIDRETALAGRGAGAEERTQAGLDRDTAQANRGASARDRQLSSVDDLTGVYSRRAGFAELKREVARAIRTGQPVMLAFVDVEHLKAVNASRGHAAGDRMLAEVAQAFRAKLRPYDLIIRYGGDEFVCAISGLSAVNATKRLALASAALAELPERASVTVGLAELGPDDSPEELVARADAALYRERQRQRQRQRRTHA